MPKYDVQIPEQATVEYLVDESARMSIIENYAKKARKMLRERLFAAQGINPEVEVKTQSIMGETFVGNVEQYSQSRLDTERLKNEEPEIYAKYLKSSNITKMTFAVVNVTVNEGYDKLMRNLRDELGLDD